MYRLLAVNGMVGIGLGSEQIANELGITARHVRRLADRSPFLALRKALFKKTARTETEARSKARRIVAELRGTLKAGGFQPHLDAGRDQARWPARNGEEPRPAFTEAS